MELYFEEKQAIYYLMRQVVRADGVFDPEERMFFWSELQRMYFNPEIVDTFEEAISNSTYNITLALGEIIHMTDEKKKYVSALLTVLVNLDSKKTPEGFENERAVVDFIPYLFDNYNVPKMSVKEAFEYLNGIGEMQSWNSPILDALKNCKWDD